MSDFITNIVMSPNDKTYRMTGSEFSYGDTFEVRLHNLQNISDPLNMRLYIQDNGVNVASTLVFTQVGNYLTSTLDLGTASLETAFSGLSRRTTRTFMLKIHDAVDENTHVFDRVNIWSSPDSAIVPAFSADDLGWVDLLGPFIATNIDRTNGRIDFNYFNAAVGFQNNARYPEEPAVIKHQVNHNLFYGTGAVARPHIHWIQQSASQPNWLFGWKKIQKGVATTIDTDFSNYTFDTIQSDVFTYTSGNLPQISQFTEIDISDLGLSDFLITVLFRDTTNVSGLFAGADPSAVTELVSDMDCHVMVDSLGSRAEYTK